MKNNSTDISLIRKYLNGELDAPAMYELERRAQDDPALMDMMLGMEYGDRDVDDANLREISKMILQRSEKDDSRLKVVAGQKRLWRKGWMAAAALLLISGMALLFLPDRPADQQVVQQQSKGKRKIELKNGNPELQNANPALQNTKLELHKNKSEQQNGNAELKNGKPEPQDNAARKNDTPGWNNKEKADTVPLNSGTRPEIATELAVLSRRKMKDSPAVMANAGQVKAKTIDSSLSLNEVVIVGYGVQRKTMTTAASTTISGAEVDGLLKADPFNRSLAGKLAGVSVGGKGRSAQNDTAAMKPSPIIGWPAYQKYLRENASLGDRKRGKVILAFRIDVKGRPVQIRIVKGATEALNQRAVRILENGAAWIRNEDSPSEELRLKIKFH